MTYSVRIKASALRELRNLDRATRQRLAEHLDRLAENPYVGTSLKGDLNGLRRIRVGGYRIVFEVKRSTLVVLVVRVAHRSGVYRR